MTPTGAGRSKEEKKHGESRQTEDNFRNFYPVLVPPRRRAARSQSWAHYFNERLSLLLTFQLHRHSPEPLSMWQR